MIYKISLFLLIGVQCYFFYACGDAESKEPKSIIEIGDQIKAYQANKEDMLNRNLAFNKLKDTLLIDKVAKTLGEEAQNKVSQDSLAMAHYSGFIDMHGHLLSQHSILTNEFGQLLKEAMQWYSRLSVMKPSEGQMYLEWKKIDVDFHTYTEAEKQIIKAQKKWEEDIETWLKEMKTKYSHSS